MIFGFLLSIAFWPSVYGAATTPRWALLAVALPVLIGFQSPKHFTALHLMGLAFIGWAAVTLAWTANVPDGMGQLIQLVILAMAFVYGSRLGSLRSTFMGLALGITVSSLIVLMQWQNGLVLTAHEGLFGNRNMLAEAAVLTLVGCVGYRLWWLIPGLLPAIVITGSRGAIVGGLVALTTWAWSKSKPACAGMTLLIIAAAAWSLSYRQVSLHERWQIWTDTAQGITIAGHGIGSFYTLYPFFAQTMDTFSVRPEHVHNDALEILFETGIFGLGLALGLGVLAFRSANMVGRCILAAFVTIGMVAFPSHLPTTAFVASLVIGHSAQRRYSLRLMFLSVGMALRPRYERLSPDGRADHPSANGGQLKPV